MPKEINSLIKGYKKFRAEYFGENKQAYERLVRYGQNPKILVIACSDSRVDPAIVTNSEPGDLFIIRNIANLVPPFSQNSDYLGTTAALEYAILHLSIRHIIVFGHSECGGIASLIETTDDTYDKNSFIPKWVEIAKPAYQAMKEQCVNAKYDQQMQVCGENSLINSLNNLRTFPWIDQKVLLGELFLHAWHFNLNSGQIKQYDQKTNEFTELKDNFL